MVNNGSTLHLESLVVVMLNVLAKSEKQKMVCVLLFLKCRLSGNHETTTFFFLSLQHALCTASPPPINSNNQKSDKKCQTETLAKQLTVFQFHENLSQDLFALEKFLNHKTFANCSTIKANQLYLFFSNILKLLLQKWCNNLPKFWDFKIF